MIKKFVLSENNDEKFLFVQQVQCHMVIQTFNQLNVLTLLVSISSAPQRRPEPPQHLPHPIYI